MQVTVSDIRPPAAGKRNGTFKCGTILYSYNPAELVFEQGKTYEVQAKQADQNPNLYFVNKAKLANGAPAQQANNPAPNSPAPQSDRWYMPFVSNTVAHALSSGLIKEPYQVKQWAAAAKQTAMELDGQREPGSDFDDFDDARPI